MVRDVHRRTKFQIANDPGQSGTIAVVFNPIDPRGKSVFN